MKKKIIVLISVIIVCLSSMFCLAACENRSNNNTYNEEFSGFTIIRQSDGYRVLYHNKTKVMYLFVKSGYGGGLSVMLDENGKPLLYEGDK